MAATATKAKTTPHTPLRIRKAYARVAGARMHYLHAGSGSPVVLIHGLTGSCRNWHKNILALARQYEVFAIDLLNMGQSDRVAGLDASLAATADRVAAFMDSAGIRQAHLCAHSHGGAVSLLLAARHPQRVRSLMLFAPANPYSDSGDGMVWVYSSPAGWQLANWGIQLPRPLQMVLLARMYGEPARITDGCLEGYVEGLRIPGTVEHILSIVRRWHADMAELRQSLPRLIEIPTLLLWGDRDRAVSIESGLRLHRELPLSEWRVFPTAGHIPFEELPEESNRLLLDWLGRQEPDASDAEPDLTIPAGALTSAIQPHQLSL